MNSKRKSLQSRISLRLKFLLRQYPAILYLLKWTIISIVISICIGSASALFLYSLEWATSFRETHIWIITLLPLAGFLIGLLYHYYGKEANGGNNLLIDTIHKPEKQIPFRMAPLIFIGTVATHLFGGSAGREGTALQMAGAIADLFRKPFRLSKHDASVLLIAATAAGFGSVFGTPLAGAVFGLEFYLIGRLRYNALFPAFISSIIADLVTKAWQAHHTHYTIPFVPDISSLNIVYAVLAGIAFGLCATAFSKGLHSASNLFKNKIAYPPLRPVIGGIIVIALVWIIDSTEYIGLGIPTIVNSFNEQLVPYAFLLKIIFTIITLSAGFKGGEVTPLFFIGAALGNMLSLFIPLPMALLAGMGFVAVFAGATNTPLACSIMAIELFGSDCGVYVAIGCIVAYLISGHTGIYGKQIIGQPKYKRYISEKGYHIDEVIR
jgi:H+/Cl- antiporter ClcA